MCEWLPACFYRARVSLAIMLLKNQFKIHIDHGKRTNIYFILPWNRRALWTFSGQLQESLHAFFRALFWPTPEARNFINLRVQTLHKYHSSIHYWIVGHILFHCKRTVADQSAKYCVPSNKTRVKIDNIAFLFCTLPHKKNPRTRNVRSSGNDLPQSEHISSKRMICFFAPLGVDFISARKTQIIKNLIISSKKLIATPAMYLNLWCEPIVIKREHLHRLFIGEGNHSFDHFLFFSFYHNFQSLS